MATTFVEYTGDGNATKQFTFPSYQESDVKVRVDGVLKTTSTHYNITSYTTTGGGNVVFTAGNIPSSPAKIRIYRDTSVDAAKATYTAGASVKAADLNNNNTQLLYRAQEEQVPNLIQSYDIGDDAIETSKIKASAVTETKIADNSIVTAKIVNGAVTTPKMADGTVSTNKLHDGSVTTAKIADSSVTTAKIADDAITNAKIATDAVNADSIAATCITGSQMADNAVNTSIIANSAVTQNKLANNSVGTPELINGSVTTDKIANDNVTLAKLGGGALPTDITVASANIVNGTITTADIGADQITNALIADNQIDSEHYVDGSIDEVHLNNNIIGNAKIINGAVIETKIGTDAVTTTKIQDGAITSAKLSDATVITSSEQGSATTNDTSFLTSAAADARFFNISSGDTIKNGDLFPDNDTTIATTAAINDRIVDLVEEVGGFVPIANETSFPQNNPDVNAQHGQQAGRLGGTIVSVKAASTNLVPSGTTVTIANGAGTGNTVTITGVSSTIPSGFGFLVETTATTHTYAFHRLVPKATEVTTVASNITNVVAAGANTTNINAVANNASNINTVAANNTNVTNVGGSISNVNAVAGNASNINTVAGINANVTTVAGISSNVTSVANNASNINSAVSNASNINSAVSNASNINTVAGSISNVNTTAGSISNVNTVASNINNVNSFFNVYRTGSSNPTTSLDVGDLFFNTTSNSLKVYTGSAWVDGVTATGSFAVVTGNTFTGSNTHNDNVKSIYGAGQDLQIFHDGTQSVIKNATGNLDIITGSTSIDLQGNDGSETLAQFLPNDRVELFYDNAAKISTASYGINIIGDARWGDNRKATFGNNGTDLEIYHDGTDNLLATSGTVLAVHRATSNSGNPVFEVRSNHGATNQVKFKVDGDGTADITGNLNVSAGIDVTGNSTLNGDLLFQSDSGNILFDKSDNALEFSDNNRAKFGGSGDLQIYHDGTDSYILENGTGVLNIKTNGTGIDLTKTPHENLARFIVDGACELYHDNSKVFSTEANGIQVLAKEGFSAFLRLYADEGDDNADKYWLKTEQDGTGFHIQNLVSGSTENNLRALGNGTVELYYDNSKKFETKSDGIDVTGEVQCDSLDVDGGFNIDGSQITYDASTNIMKFTDNAQLRFGSGNDLRLYHNGSHSYIQHEGTGNVHLRGNGSDEIRIQAKGGEQSISCIPDAAVELYHDNVKKLQTVSSGIEILGTEGVNAELFISADEGDDNNDKHKLVAFNNEGRLGIFNYVSGGWEVNINTFGNGAVKLYYDNNEKFRTESFGATVLGGLDVNTGSIKVLTDGYKFEAGASGDLQMYHSGSDSFIDETGTGDLKIRTTNGGGIQLISGTSENMITCASDGAVELYHNGNRQVFTIDGGMNWQDNKKAEFGNSGDLKIYHDGSRSQIAETGIGPLRISTDEFQLMNVAQNENIITAAQNLWVKLHYDGVERIVTTGTGSTLSNSQAEPYATEFSCTSSHAGIFCNPAGQYQAHVRFGYGDTRKWQIRVPFQEGAETDLRIYNWTNTADVWRISPAGTVQARHTNPQSNNTYDLGTPTARWRNIYTADLQMSNEGSANDVDGTWGNYTMQEGENDLYLINNRSGKKYKFNLTEVS